MIGNHIPQTTDIIDPKTAGTIAGLFRERVRRTPREVAYRCYNEEIRRFDGITWQEMSSRAARWQAALERDGLQSGDRVAVILKNCVQWTLFDLASLGLGLVTVPLFADDRPENIAYILKETGARFLLVENEEQWMRVEETGDRLPGIQMVVTVNHSDSSPANGFQGEAPSRQQREVFLGDSADTGSGSRTDSERATVFFKLTSWLPEDDREYIVKCGEPTDLATIVYTSGTTGLPKGVMLSHRNMLENTFACLKSEPIYREDQFLSFLPLSHTFERTVGYYIPMMAGACVTYVRSIDKLAEDLLDVRPTVLISVPRIYERFHQKIVLSIGGKPALFRHLFNLTVHTGWQLFLYRQGRRRWYLLLLLWPLLNRIMGKRITRMLGGRLRLSISGGAPLEPSIARVFIGLGLNFLQGYGLTETSPVISVNTTNDNIPSTVGRPIPNVKTVIASDGELLVKGPNVMLGYWRDREATEAAIDADGYLHTGDITRMDENGHLTIVGRKKEIIVLSTGEKVPPGDLELAVAVNPLFEQVMIVGEGRPYLAALVVLNHHQWEKLAAGHGISSQRQEILSDDRVEKILLSEIARMITRFPGYAQVRRVHASLLPWKMQDGLITNTLKLRRTKLLEKFKQEIESLFRGH